MRIIEKQQISEIIDIADIAVRAASQMRLFKVRKSIRDMEAILRAKDFLTAAICGGNFIATGQVGGFQASLRPLNWAADVQIGFGSKSNSNAQDLNEYVKLTSSLEKLRHTLAQLSECGSVDAEIDIDDAISFFHTLGEKLGTAADQASRVASNSFSRPHSMARS